MQNQLQNLWTGSWDSQKINGASQLTESLKDTYGIPDVESQKGVLVEHRGKNRKRGGAVSYTHLRAHETDS